MSDSQILSMTNAQYRELLQIGIWSSAKSTNPGSAFSADEYTDGKLHPGQSCQRIPWKLLGPKDGDPEENFLINRKWILCGKCRSLNPNHTTS